MSDIRLLIGQAEHLTLAGVVPVGCITLPELSTSGDEVVIQHPTQTHTSGLLPLASGWRALPCSLHLTAHNGVESLIVVVVKTIM